RDFHVTGVQTCALPISRDTYKFSFSIPTLVNRAYTNSATRALKPGAQWVDGKDDGWDKKSAYNQGHPITDPIKEAGASVSLTRKDRQSGAQGKADDTRR